VTTLTRAQLAALTTLHRDGEAWGQGRGVGIPGTRQRTLNALVRASLASNDHPTGRAFRPTSRTWADGFGIWHVVIPAPLAVTTHGAAIARAIMLGELSARQGQPVRYRFTPRRRMTHDDGVEYVEGVA
jgi:hypothetical protein